MTDTETALTDETRKQLLAAGWSDLKIERANLRRIERQIRATRDPWLLRSLGAERKRAKDAVAAWERSQETGG